MAGTRAVPEAGARPAGTAPPSKMAGARVASPGALGWECENAWREGGG